MLMSASLWAGLNLMNGEIIVKTKINRLAAQMLAKNWYLSFPCYTDAEAAVTAADFVIAPVGSEFDLDNGLYMRIEPDGVYLCEMPPKTREEIDWDERMRSFMEVYV